MNKVDVEPKYVLPGKAESRQTFLPNIDDIRENRLIRARRVRERLLVSREKTRSPNSEWLNTVLDVDKSE
jgi:hypothetical protein